MRLSARNATPLKLRKQQRPAAASASVNDLAGATRVYYWQKNPNAPPPTQIMKIARSRTHFVTIAALLSIAACGGGDEDTEDGQLVEKTDVRVVGVDFGTAVDSTTQRVTGAAGTFAPTDHIYASVRTKGSSPKTTLGVRWKNEAGDEITGNNVWIRPTGDTSTVFGSPWLINLKPGQYTLDVRVNGATVKTAKFTVGEEAVANAEAANTEGVASDSVPTESATPETHTPGIFSTAMSRVRDEFTSLTHSTLVLIGRERKDQSPFEWHGLRAGMRLSEADRLSQPARPWERTPFLRSVVGFRRYTAPQNKDLGAGTLTILADTAEDRVLSVDYGVTWMPKDSAPRVAFEHEMEALGQKWDKLPGVIRQQTGQTTGPYFFEWATPDSTWSAEIYYDGSVRRAGRPTGFEIKEMHWDQRVFAQISDSMKAQLRNPNSEYYHPRPPASARDSTP